MIANFFQSLNTSGVGYLLISGQATVLYGAATFSEDIDLWVEPSAANIDRFLGVLRGLGARYYKLTPPFTPGHLARGHGFHFLLGAGEQPVFLDVMGHPPRVGTFAEAELRACWMETEWGAVRTIGLRDLVELKKTQRLEDYPVISRLALAWLARPECRREREDFAWALANIFTLPELAGLFMEAPEAVLVAEGFHPAIRDYARQVRELGDSEAVIEQAVRELLQKRIGELQLADRNYWRSIIAELRGLRAAGGLMPEGLAV